MLFRSATLDVRALPDEDMGKFYEQLRRVIGDPRVEVVPNVASHRPASPPSRLDTEMFAAFNAHDVNKLMAYFADNVEFYHDKGGLSNFAQTKEGFAHLFAQSPDITRTLVPGTLEVYPVKNYGAMHIAIQRFCHVENGRNDCGNSKFVMVWQQQAGTWRITRVVSYDH